MKLPRALPTRRGVQWVFTLIVILIGVRFTLWVSAHLSGELPQLRRPAGVDAFLPIDAMMGLRQWLATGVVDAVHPAGLAIFVGICLMSLVLARSFCSHVCPVGLLSELLGRLGVRLTGATLRPPRWLDIPLRSLKLLLLGFFVWAVWFAMDLEGVRAFLISPYARVADAKMWLFFASPSRLTIAVLGVLVVGSIFVRDLWCRYLCPYGALVGILGRLALLKPCREPSLCTSCEACTRACPADLKVHESIRLASIECTGCQDCVVACPVEGCLRISPPRSLARSARLRPAGSALVATSVLVAVMSVFWLTGHWHSAVTEAEYHRRIQEIDSPLYTHVGGQAGPVPDGSAVGDPAASARPVGRGSETPLVPAH
jgi:polyferredoxin